ncbi:MAG: PAAR domain-containing protein [Proteobacteria bacterium]|nr:PAAR domain-containing protein [Pseudomonadota bacterium]
MANAARKGDIGSAHGCFPPSPSIEGSGDVIINGQPAMRVGDAIIAHGCGKCPPHPRKAAQGSASVNINGKAAVRLGDAVDCGGSLQTGSGNVFIGDLSWAGAESLPARPKIKLYLTQTPGNQNNPYTFEPYKLYKDGSLEKEGHTDENGLIEYEYDPPWKSVLKVETEMGTYTFHPTPLAPVDTQQGMNQRLAMLGFYPEDYKGSAHNEGGKPHFEHAQTIIGTAMSGALDEAFIKTLKPIIP